MGSVKRPHAFDPLDLEIIDRVYEAIWAQIEARYPHRESEQDEMRREALRRWLFARAKGAPVDFDSLYDKVLASIPKTWATAEAQRSSSPEVSLQADAGHNPDRPH